MTRKTGSHSYAHKLRRMRHWPSSEALKAALPRRKAARTTVQQAEAGTAMRADAVDATVVVAGADVAVARAEQTSKVKDQAKAQAAVAHAFQLGIRSLLLQVKAAAVAIANPAVVAETLKVDLQGTRSLQSD